ncbi:MAG: efflux RND transporter permease subunit, partial [Deltaproteobacteria bacterium]
MFAFIVVLGIVVDDAIVIGENIYTKLTEGIEPVSAAIQGAVEMAYPVINSVATTIVAFAPMLFVSGVMGKFMRVFPVAIIAVLLVSLMEALVILPSHLAHMKQKEDMSRKWNPLAIAERIRIRVQSRLDRFVDKRFLPFMRVTLRQRYIFTAGVVTLLILSAGLVAGGRLAFVFFPKVDSDRISVKLLMPGGTSFKTTQQAVKNIEKAAWDMAASYPRKDGRSVIQHMFAVIGEQVTRETTQDTGSHVADVVIELLDSQERGITSSEMASVWRGFVGQIPGASSLTFSSSAGGPRPGGKPIEIVLLGDNMNQLLGAADRLKARLGRYEGVEDIEDSYRPGKKELRLSLRQGARQLGLTLQDLARQIRANFWGEEALKVQRGRNEVTIRVRYPEHERKDPGDLESMKVRTADNKEVPFNEVARVEEYRGPSNIRRMYGRRTVTVSADVDEEKANAAEILGKLSESYFSKLKKAFPGVNILIEGQQKERNESMDSLFDGMLVALFLIFVLLVNMFRTYTHALIVMTAGPFSFIGIVAGHLLFGMDFTILSMFGILALTGVVVNDSLLLIESTNREIANGLHLIEALVSGARNRFRQIILTSLSTAAGLLPLLLETSFQAQFLKPMAITVVFGLLASTLLIL